MPIFDPNIKPVSVEEVYGSSVSDQAETLLDRSLSPRAPTMLYDTMAELGVGRASVVLDIGCRDAAHTCALAERFGCRCIGIDPVASLIERAGERIAEQNLGERVRVQRGEIASLDVAADGVDFIWCRDVLSHVRDLATGLRECARVLRPGGMMLVYQTFATGMLEPREAAWLYAALAIEPANMNPQFFEQRAAHAGLTIVKRDAIDSEWRERMEEDGLRTTSKQLLRLARMRRDYERLERELGSTYCLVEMADCVWGVFQMLGKLCPMVYVLRRG